jgi:hypothetical protein
MYVEKSVRINKKGIVRTQYFLRQSRHEGKKNYQNDASEYHQLGRVCKILQYFVRFFGALFF